MFISFVLYVFGRSRQWRGAAGSLRREQQGQTIRVTGQLVPKEVQRLRTHCNARTQAKPVIKPRKAESSLVRSLERQKKPEEQNRLRPADYFCSTNYSAIALLQCDVTYRGEHIRRQPTTFASSAGTTHHDDLRHPSFQLRPRMY